MRILALTNLYPNPFQPYRAPFNRHQFRLLGERHPVRVVAPVAWTDELRARRGGAAPLPRGRRVELDGLMVDHPRYLYPPKLGRGWYGHCYRMSVGRAVRRAAREFKPDLLFAPWAYPDGWAAVKLARSLGLPAVVQVHGSDVLLAPRSPARLRRTRDALCAADGVVAVSENLARTVVPLGVDPSRVRVIIDGVDPALFRPGPKAVARAKVGQTDGTPVLLFVGNLLPVKGLDVLLAACGQLLRTGFRLRLVVVGQGPLRAALEKQAAELGLVERVRFTGPLPLADLPDWYRAADLFVLPSRSEGVPNVLLEASACGTPWVASRVGGIPEIAPLGVSRLVPPEDPAALAAAIRESLSAPPPGRPPGPRDRGEAVAELADFLRAVVRTRAAT